MHPLSEMYTDTRDPPYRRRERSPGFDDAPTLSGSLETQSLAGEGRCCPGAAIFRPRAGLHR
jgi:hypothetical protein